MSNTEPKFYHYGTNTWESDAVFERNKRWFIKPGFANYNGRANNWDGYATRARAERAILRLQNA